MQQTLFYIPLKIGGIPIFGFGLLLALWVVFSVTVLVWLGWRHGLGADTWSSVFLFVLIGAVIWLVLPRVCEPEGLPIRGYGVMLLLAVAAAVALMLRRGRQIGLDPEIVFGLAFWAFVPGIIGARVFYIAEYWEEFHKASLMQTLAGMANVTQGGLVVYGSLVGAMIGLAVFVARRNLPVLATFDLLAPSMMLGMAIGRLGCLMNGCCYGGACDLPWAVTFPAGSPAHVHQLDQGQVFFHGLHIVGDREGLAVIDQVQPGSSAETQGLRRGQTIAAINGLPVRTVGEARQGLLLAHTGGNEIAITVQGDPTVHRVPMTGPPRSNPIHPTQIYSAINGLILCLFLLAYDPWRKRDGELWAMFLTLYPITRFLLEMVRVDEPAVFGTGLTPSQNISLLLLACGVALWIYLARKPHGTAFPKWRDITQEA